MQLIPGVERTLGGRMSRGLAAVFTVTGMVLGWFGHSCSVESRESQLAQKRLASLEAAMAREVPVGTPARAVLGFLRRQAVAYEPVADEEVESGSIPAWGITVYIGEWPGLVFRNGLHLTLRFDKSGNLAGHDVVEVSGS